MSLVGTRPPTVDKYIYVYQSYQLENIEIKEFRDGLTVMEHAKR